MKWTILYDDVQRYVEIICDGRFSLSDNDEMYAELFEQNFWRSGLCLLIDHRLTDFNALKFDVLRSAAAKHVNDNQRIGDGKMAFLMNSTRDFGIARQYGLMTQGFVLSKVMAFRDESEARDWLHAE